MYTGVAEQSVWMKKFGIDCEHIDEMEILRLAELIDKDREQHAFEWLTENIGCIHYDGEGLTEEKLRFQIRCYLATKDMVRDRELSFIGIKCQPEMGNHFVTQCLSQAFLNDPYDMEGGKGYYAYGLRKRYGRRPYHVYDEPADGRAAPVLRFPPLRYGKRRVRILKLRFTVHLLCGTVGRLPGKPQEC